MEQINISHKIIDGKKQAEQIKDEVRSRVMALQELGWQPRLVSIDVGNNSAVTVYINNQRRACEQVGIHFEHRHYPENTTRGELLATIHALNIDPRVTGIILQRPCHPYWIWSKSKTPSIPARMWKG